MILWIISIVALYNMFCVSNVAADDLVLCISIHKADEYKIIAPRVLDVAIQSFLRSFHIHNQSDAQIVITQTYSLLDAKIIKPSNKHKVYKIYI